LCVLTCREHIFYIHYKHAHGQGDSQRSSKTSTSLATSLDKSCSPQFTNKTVKTVKNVVATKPPTLAKLLAELLKVSQLLFQPISCYGIGKNRKDRLTVACQLPSRRMLPSDLSKYPRGAYTSSMFSSPRPRHRPPQVDLAIAWRTKPYHELTKTTAGSTRSLPILVVMSFKDVTLAGWNGGAPP
jgi:hypothetical protein